MGPNLLRHRRGILGAILALYLIAGAWQFAQEPLDARVFGLLVFARLLAPFAALLITSNGLISLIAARRGEPLDRRPSQAALAGVALLWIGVFILVLGGTVTAFATALAGIGFLMFALVDWIGLFALLRSRSMIEHRGSGVIAPPIVGGVHSPIVLFAPSSTGYREDAKGTAIASIPPDRRIAQKRLVMQVVMALACAFVALPGGALAAAPATKEEIRQEAKPQLVGSRWRGDIDFGVSKNRFTLEIEEAKDGNFTGVMDWGDVAANIEGRYRDDGKGKGTVLVFYDRSLRRTNGAPFVLNDRKDVTIIGDDMVGTDKGGRTRLRAKRIK